MQQKSLIAVIVLLLGLLCWMLFIWQPSKETDSAVTLTESPHGGDFLLQGVNGPVALQDYRGNVVLLYFGYTWCPDICPTSLALFSSALNELTAKELSMVQPIFISVDPLRDTPERLQEYSHYFHEKLIGITGDPDAVAEAAELFGVAYRAVNPDENENYAVDHSADIYLIDTRGELVKRLPHGTTVAILLAEIRAQLLSGPRKSGG